MILREVIKGEDFLSLSSKEVVKLISSDKLAVPSEEKVSKPKCIIVIFLYKGMENDATFVYNLIYFINE